MGINIVNISGNLTRDPEVKMDVGRDGLAVISVANNRSRLKAGTGRDTGVPAEFDEYVTYLDVKVWKRTLVEQIARDLKKGSGVTVAGRLDLETWDAEDGSKRSKHVLTVTDQAHDVLMTNRYTPRGEAGQSSAGQPTGGNVFDDPSQGEGW